MGSTYRKRKQRDHEAPRLASEGLAGAILALPPQPQPICCRVEGCREALAPGYHKKYRICITHSTYDELLIDGKTCRWCQQCGSFHGLEAFDAKYRSCRRSLARHQERRKHRQALQGSGGKKSKQARQRRLEQRRLQDEQGSQQGEAEHEAQLRPHLPPLTAPLPLPQLPSLPLPAQPMQQDQAAASPARQSVEQHRPQQAAGTLLGANVLQAAAAAWTPRTKMQPSEQPEHSSSDVHSSKRAHELLPAAAPPAVSMQLVQRPDAMQPVTPPGQPGSLARSLALEQPPPAWAPVCTAYTAPPPPPQQHALWPLQQATPAAPAAAAATAWGQQAPDRGWLLIVNAGDQRLAPVQPALLPQQAMLSAAACQAPQGGPAFWLLRHASQDPGGSSGASGGGSGASGATYYPCYEPAQVQRCLPVHTPVALEPFTFRQLAEAAACSASTAAGPLSPRMGGAAGTLQTCGSTYIAATPLAPNCGGSSGAPPPSPQPAAGVAGMPGEPSFWVAASLRAGQSVLPAALPPEGCTGSSSALSQAWGQLARQERDQAALLAAATPHTTTQLSLQPGQMPSPHAALQPSQPPGPHAAPQHSLQPSWHTALPPSRMPSLPPPRAQLGCQPAEAGQQQPGWQSEWADEALIASQLPCPQSPAVSWLNGF